jgi:hypothetical protein
MSSSYHIVVIYVSRIEASVFSFISEFLHLKNYFLHPFANTRSQISIGGDHFHDNGVISRVINHSSFINTDFVSFIFIRELILTLYCLTIFAFMNYNYKHHARKFSRSFYTQHSKTWFVVVVAVVTTQLLRTPMSSTAPLSTDPIHKVKEDGKMEVLV